MADKNTESHPIDPPIEVRIPGYSEEAKFNALEEVRDFAEGEQTAWAWIGESGKTGEPAPINQVSSHYTSNLDKLNNWIGQAAGTPGVVQQLDNIKNTLSMYETGNLLCSKSADGQFIIGLAKDDPLAALGALAFLTNQPWPLHDRNWRHVLRGVTLLAVSRVDEKGAVARAAKALEELRREWGKRLGEQRTLFEGLQADGISQQKAIDTEQARVAQVWTEQGETAKTFFQDAQQDKDNLERTFTEHMRLKAPAKYWKDKAGGHLLWASISFVAFAVLSGGAAKLLFDRAPEILKLVTPVYDGGFPWGNLIVITLPALAFFWFLRFVARIFVTNLQRRDDALERATMVETYLALMSEGENVAGPDERILILNALFRPGPGDAPDMAPPADLLEIIKRRPKD